jgi:hypothetical protein
VGKVEGKWQKGSNQVFIHEDGDTVLTLKWRWIRARGDLSFQARAEELNGGGTRLQVGADRLPGNSDQAPGADPIGPDSIVHFGSYKKFLDRVSQELLVIDSSAQVSIEVHEE